MPALTPAEVQIFPCWMKMESLSTSTAGKFVLSMSHMAQWVAARLPSSSPALASRKAPLQTEAVRRNAPELLAIHSMSSPDSATARSISGAPGTIRVSRRVPLKLSSGWLSTASPSAVGISPP
ncbi:hypothetical protein D9M68_252800 [compost metagenome]